VRFSSADCLFCHGVRPGVEADPKVLVDETELEQSVHGDKLQCHDCHVDVGVDLQSHKAARKPVDCSRCHGPSPSMVPAEYRGRADSIHQRSREEGSGQVPTCRYCHGAHDVQRPNAAHSRVNRGNIRKTCGACHAHSDTPRSKAAPQTALNFDKSIHGRAESEPGVVAATCTDCHLPHHPSARASTHPIRKQDIPGLCGKCHKEIYEGYRNTIHGRDLARGNLDVPACQDCHGEHTIQAPSDATSSVNPAHIVQTCTRCHDNKQLQRRYGLPADRAGTYGKSYHGISNRFGDIRAANCATCHTAHHILPSSDPKSSVNPKNLQHTCGRAGCHKGVTSRFELGQVHLAPSRQSEKLVYWVGLLYKLMVIGVVAFFCVSILLDVTKRIVLRLTSGGRSR
jgi:predicted CXXCH cytochrome family protein